MPSFYLPELPVFCAIGNGEFLSAENTAGRSHFSVKKIFSKSC